ncbi:MAG: O-methyltransferase [Prevotella sp.]|nr:O-methyltransferase [Prevotella sp.]
MSTDLHRASASLVENVSIHSVCTNLDDYIRSHIDPEPELLHALYHEANIRLVNGRMASGHLQGRILKMFVRMVRPRNILEIGTYAGYSAMCMAEGLDEGGMVYTFEINDELEDFTRSWIARSDVSDRIRFIIGDGLKEAPKLGIVFDMAFIDGNKRNYTEAYEAVLPLIRPKGFILADNTLWDGHILDPAYDRDKQTLGIRRFNDYVAGDDRVEKVIVPVRDGMTIIMKK